MSDENRFNVISRDLTDVQLDLIKHINGTAALLAGFMGQHPNRASSIAITNLETSIMWAIKGVCLANEINDEDHIR